MAHAHEDESALRNYRWRVAVGLLVLATIILLVSLYGDLSPTAATLWVACVLAAYPASSLVEVLIKKKLAGLQAADPVESRSSSRPEQVAERQVSASFPGTVDHYISSQDFTDLHVLEDVETPDGSFNFLLIHSDGRVVVTLRSSRWNALTTASKDDWQVVRLEAEGLLDDTARIDAVLSSIHGGRCAVYPVLILPSGSDAVTRDGPTFRISLVAEDEFCDFMEQLPAPDQGNQVVFEHYLKLRAIIKG